MRNDDKIREWWMLESNKKKKKKNQVCYLIWKVFEIKNKVARYTPYSVLLL